MRTRLVILLTALCVMLSSVGGIAEVESNNAHMATAGHSVDTSSSFEPDTSSDHSAAEHAAEHEDHCCHGHVMADPGQAQAAAPMGLIRTTRHTVVSADSLAFAPPVRPPKRSSLPSFA